MAKINRVDILSTGEKYIISMESRQQGSGLQLNE